jgi:nucleoside-diphosphate-sugar epimerase
MATKVLIVGCGDLGTAVAKQLVQAGLQTIGVRRNAWSIEGVAIIQADVTKSDTLEPLSTIQPEVLIYCVAANAQTDDAYKAAYVDGLRYVLATQVNNLHLKHVFFISSTRIYGQNTEALLDEAMLATPTDFGGKRLLEAEQLLKGLHCHSTALRLSGIYGPDRLRMINLAQLPNSWPKQNNWSNRIHRDDAAAFIVFLIKQVFAENTPSSSYIVTDSKPATQYDVLTWIAARLAVKAPEFIPPAEGGKRLSNSLMLATGFRLQYPDYQAGYQALLLNYYTK